MLNPPLHIPGLEIHEELGRGASSVVYRASQGTAPRAVKIARVRGRWTRWFYREAVALARVRHPGLPAVLEVGELDDRPYIVMELVHGETLADSLRHGAVGEAKVLSLGVELADILSAVHAVGLVHRDVKPRNIVVQPDGRIRLVDLGFATPMARQDVEAAGTRSYAAPEQFLSPTTVDARADLYALGRVLLECLTGSPLPEASRVPALCATLARPVATLLGGLLAIDPNERYGDASAVLRDLRALQAGSPPAGPAEPALRLATPPGRERELAALSPAWADPSAGAPAGASARAVFLVRGARGSGKTRLLDAWVAQARDAGARRVVRAACREHDPPLATLRRLVEGTFGDLVHGSAGERAAAEVVRAAAADQLAPFARLIAPSLSTVLGRGAGLVEAAAGGFPEGAAELLLRLARSGGPLALVVDDLQWIDPVSRDALARVVERVGEAPLSLVLAARGGAPGSAHEGLLRLVEERGSTVDLLPLSEEQIRQIVASHLGDDGDLSELTRRVQALADGTPLGVLEVLGAFLDVGALRPHGGRWTLDLRRAEKAALPDGVHALLDRRVGELPPATQRVLEAAAVLGTRFEDGLLAGVVGLAPSDLAYGLADARQAGLVEPDARGSHRLVHDSLRELLNERLASASKQALHQRAAELLDVAGASFEDVCASARHYADGEHEKSPVRAYRACRAAAEGALARFDNENAIVFLDDAGVAARVGGVELDADFYRMLGEAELRLGRLAQSLRAFEVALRLAADDATRATMLGRIAWVHQSGADPEKAWAALGLAFDRAGARMPVESLGSAAHTLGQVSRLAWATRFRSSASASPEARTRGALLCELHYQNARLGMEYGKPLRFLQSTVEGLKVSETLGPSRAQVRARASYGVVLCAMGLREAGSAELERARRMVEPLQDPITQAFSVQMRALAACFEGAFDRALVLLRECADDWGPWLELNEYCQDCASGDFIESLRGRSRAAWTWNERAIGRTKQVHPSAPVSSDHVVLRARASLAALGRDAREDPWLVAQIAKVSTREMPRESFAKVLSWGPRARFFLETGDLGADFEALVRSFQSEGIEARSAHPLLVEYYVAVAHARVHQCLRATSAGRAPHVASLETALLDLRAAAKVPLYDAHRLAIEGLLAWLKGAPRDARRLLLEAEALAVEETCPWVLYSVARARAHMLREEGKLDAARDHARVAESLAVEHGAEPRARWIREELGLAPAATRKSVAGASSIARSQTSSTKVRRQLATLVRTVRVRANHVRPSDLATAILDDLFLALGAERGMIALQPEPSAPAELFVGRSRRGASRPEPEGWRDTVVRSLLTHGQSWPPEDEDGLVESDDERVLGVPLFLNESVVGAVCLERGLEAPPFVASDRELLVVLSLQIPIAFELARLLAERDKADATLKRLQRMEVVGQLAGGIAHDFNNMLAVILGSLDVAGRLKDLDPEVASELAVISGVARRAAALTRQLLGLSRVHATATLVPSQMGELVLALAPLLRRLLPENVALELHLPPTHPVDTDRAAFDQALVNLVVNARDAMPAGGTIHIETRNVVLDESALQHGATRTGDHVVLEVSDTGQGMTEEVLERAFDPCFTTKPEGTGAGLGLTTVHSFATSSAGYIELSSDVGVGTTFSIFVPRSSAEAHDHASRGRARDAREGALDEGSRADAPDDPGGSAMPAGKRTEPPLGPLRAAKEALSRTT